MSDMRAARESFYCDFNTGKTGFDLAVDQAILYNTKEYVCALPCVKRLYIATVG
jgi:hypothetical protein